MTQDIVTLYVSLLSEHFTLSSARHSPRTDASAADPNATPPLPPFVPPISNATATCHWLIKCLNELTETVHEMTALELTGEATQSLKELVSSARWRFEEAICSSWIRDAKVFYRLETWVPDADDASKTSYLNQIASFQRFCAISAYRVAGGSEEKANALLGSSTGTASRGRQDPVSFIS
jgi:exocyst complex component 2